MKTKTLFSKRLVNRGPSFPLRKTGALGFTLIELLVVIALMATVMAIVLPQLMPAIVVSTHEGAARHMMGYGRSVIAHAILFHEEITVKVDLDEQQYWAERWPEPELDPDEKKAQEAARSGNSEEYPEDPLELMALAREEFNKEDEEDTDYDLLDHQSQVMLDSFELMMRQALYAKARNVIQDDRGVLDDVTPLFDDRFSLDIEDDELEPEELILPFLIRTALPEEIFLESVRVGENLLTHGVAEIIISPFGLTQPVAFFLVNEDGDYLTVEWDPITGGAHLREGKETLF